MRPHLTKKFNMQKTNIHLCRLKMIDNTPKVDQDSAYTVDKKKSIWMFGQCLFLPTKSGTNKQMN